VVTEAPDDPVLVRRARFAAWSGAGLRVGYLFVAVALISFIFAFATDFPQAGVDVTIIGLVGACVFLPPSMIIGYAVKAAEREDRQSGRLS
jgi:sugar phosphate permease